MIIIYSTPHCVYCDKVKDLFDKHKIKYTVVNVAESDETVENFREKTGQMGVPVTEINGKFIIGYKESELLMSIKELKREGDYQI